MARTLDLEAHSLRRDAFVDVTQRLIQIKGYEQLSIQDVLDELGASKGAFYHYFDSKSALLEAVVERMTDAAMAVMTPIVDDPGLSGLSKLTAVFSALAQWKGERKEFVLELIRVWMSDDNIVVREHFRRSVTARLTPLFTRIVRQGTAEGVFRTGSPEGAATVLVALIQAGGDRATQLFLARQANTISIDDVRSSLAAYAEANERILGLPTGSWPMLDEANLQLWFS